LGVAAYRNGSGNKAHHAGKTQRCWRKLASNRRPHNPKDAAAGALMKSNRIGRLPSLLSAAIFKLFRHAIVAFS
jgi:hypothetical protein